MKTSPVTDDRKRRRRNDLLFISLLLAAVIAVGLCLYLLRGEGDTVTVTVDGQVYAVYPLDTDRVEEIVTQDGVNRLVIRGGEAYVESATCPDGICAAHKPIHRNGESIVCLPHRVVITVSSASDADAPDAVL